MLKTSCTGFLAWGYTGLSTYHRHVLWVILACLFGLDIITTTISLRLGNFEINPLMIPFADNPLLHGLVEIGAFMLLFIAIEKAVLFIREKRPENEPFPIKLHYRTLYGLILCALISLIWLYSSVLLNNIQVISSDALFV